MECVLTTKPRKISSGFTCEQCKITFDNMDDKEEHIKLEHSEHRLPSGSG